MSLEGKRVAILVEDDFEDIELAEPVRAMREAGARVVVIGSGTKDVYRGKRGGLEVRPDAIARNVEADSFDALIIPGGYAPDKMRLSPPMVDLVRKVHEKGKLVAAICHGPQLLISAGIVKGRRLTSWPSVAIDLTNAGAEWTDEPVVEDGNIITSRKPGDLPQFNRAITLALEGK